MASRPSARSARKASTTSTRLPYVRRLVEEGSHYFLSRPRRFGKSLFLDTLKELFEGNEALFEGLDIHGRHDWSIRHPVLRLSFGAGDFRQPGFLEANLMEKLAAAEADGQVTTDYTTLPGRFAALLAALHRRVGRRVVVLVDEYDKPILDALETPDVARANRNFLRGFYAVVKDCDAHVRFTFITGVSKFSKISLFSGLNNLRDITLDPRYAGICGYTDFDLDAVFAAELPGLDREEIRRWYNGYDWLGGQKVYNPFDILLLFDSRKFAAHWFETGTPAFLVETLVGRGVGSFALEEMAGTDELLSALDVGDMATEALLFQTGYLTIRDHERSGGRTVYRLGFPNQEVRQSLNDSLSRYLAGDSTRQMANSIRLYELLKANDFTGLKALFHAFYASIPHQWLRQQRHRELRGVLRERVLFLLRRTGTRRGGRGQYQPRASGHGGALQRARLPVRIQGGGDGAGRRGDGAVEGAAVRRQVPSSGTADPPHRRGVQQGCPQPRGVRGGARVVMLPRQRVGSSLESPPPPPPPVVIVRRLSKGNRAGGVVAGVHRPEFLRADGSRRCRICRN